MTRIHFVVSESAKIRYQSQAGREGKSLGKWMREAAEEKLAASASRKFTAEDLRRFIAEIDKRHPPGRREPDWEETKRIIAEGKLHGLPTP